jgi:hypothetical protein
MNSGDEIAIGNTKKIADQKRSERMNFSLSLEKKKKANPTTPYNLIKVPKTMSMAAQKSCFLSMKT